jgi:predicted DCC family thiol-disulfide oxidoreductase YuxK
MQQPEHIIIFDGFCGLCSRIVRFIKRRDKKKLFSYFPLQSKEAEAFSGLNSTDPVDLSTVILIAQSRFYYRSEAAIRILMALGGVYRLSAILLAIPAKIRDWFYTLIAMNRHRFFGKTDSCELNQSE